MPTPLDFPAGASLQMGILQYENGFGADSVGLDYGSCVQEGFTGDAGTRIARQGPPSKCRQEGHSRHTAACWDE